MKRLTNVYFTLSKTQKISGEKCLHFSPLILYFDLIFICVTSNNNYITIYERALLLPLHQGYCPTIDLMLSTSISVHSAISSILFLLENNVCINTFLSPILPSAFVTLRSIDTSYSFKHIKIYTTCPLTFL